MSGAELAVLKEASHGGLGCSGWADGFDRVASGFGSASAGMNDKKAGVHLFCGGAAPGLQPVVEICGADEDDHRDEEAQQDGRSFDGRSDATGVLPDHEECPEWERGGDDEGEPRGVKEPSPGRGVLRRLCDVGDAVAGGAIDEDQPGGDVQGPREQEEGGGDETEGEEGDGVAQTDEGSVVKTDADGKGEEEKECNDDLHSQQMQDFDCLACDGQELLEEGRHEIFSGV